MGTVLVTGGAGYIGSHTCLVLLAAGYEVVIVDNLINASPLAIDAIANLSQQPDKLHFYAIDINDTLHLREIFAAHKPDAVIHFAGLKSVPKSVGDPLAYYQNNLVGTINLLQIMTEFECLKIVFSSSATVYGNPIAMPLKETQQIIAGDSPHPYGRTKVIIEHILEDLYIADPRWSVALLRYFNPVGAHESGHLGEDPNGTPANLMPILTQIAIGKIAEFKVTGYDYDTPDGTGVRDYLHVVDVAEGHLAALQYLNEHAGVEAINLGNGRGYSVLEFLKTFEEASGVKIPYTLAPRRPGDIASSIADPSKAELLLGWQAKRDLYTMCADAWRWQTQHPQGFQK